MQAPIKKRLLDSPRKLLRILKTEMEKGKDHPGKMAASIALGLFFGIVPIWGFQMLAAFTTASVLKLNRVVVLLASSAGDYITGANFSVDGGIPGAWAHKARNYPWPFRS